MDLQLRSMDQFPLQQSMILMELISIQSLKKFTSQNLELEISEDGIEHPKQLEQLFIRVLQYINHYILISKMMELVSSLHQIIVVFHYFNFTHFMQMVSKSLLFVVVFVYSYYFFYSIQDHFKFISPMEIKLVQSKVPEYLLWEFRSIETTKLFTL